MVTAPIPRSVRRLLTGVAFSAVGNGLVLPFLVIYLHEVRGFSLSVAGLVLATIGVVGLIAVPLAGMLVDRLGARLVLLACLLDLAVGMACYAFVRQPWHAFLVAGIVAIGWGSYWPAMTALLSTQVSAEARPRVFGVQFALLNAGIGIGGIVGGLLVDVRHPGTFELVYLLDALTFLPLALLLFAVRDVGKRPDTLTPDAEPRAPSGGYRAVLGDRAFMRVSLLSTALVIVGYAQLESGMPAFARAVSHVSTRVVGFGFAANTATIVAAQLLVLNRLHGRRRSHALALVALIWAASWALLGLGGVVNGNAARAALIVVSLAVFGFGETLLSPIAPAITNDLAPEALRGRYNAIHSMTWNAAFVVGPATAGVLLGHHLPALWISLLIGGCLLVALLALRLERHLTPEQNGQQPADEVPEPEPSFVGGGP